MTKADPALEATIGTASQPREDALANWSPISGDATAGLLSRQRSLDDEACTNVRTQALRILSRCGDPTEREPRRQAHLVVGEVQSGKTLSFTTIIALARDNDFPLVVVVAGTKLNLLAQTAKRFQSDLLTSDGRPPAFRRFIAGEHNEQDLTNALRAAMAEDTPKEYRPTVVVFVLKNQGRIKKLADGLAKSIGEVGHVPALIIDDEADQAGMNIAKPGKESTVYASLARLRRSVPRNDMLMYTATPQAPLLMTVSDEWAPRTVAVLRSGEGYVGGKRLFVDGHDDYVRLIADAEFPDALDWTAEDPPPSLREAVLFYLLALTATQKNGPRPLSMLIHPAHTRDLHGRYESWTRAMIDGLHEVLRDPHDVAFDEFLDELRPLYMEMVRTAGKALLTFDESVQLIRHLIRLVEIRVVNSDNPEEITPDDWGQAPGWIVIGGAKLDRGFTIENLAVTYMPRGTGVRAADAIQQRGRFFGYKAHYAGYLRGWFNADTAEAFRQYVTHERSVVDGLFEVERTSTSLRDWKRQFLIDDRYRPTRKSAWKLLTTSWPLLTKHGWFVQQQPYDIDTVDDNLATFKRLVEAAGALEREARDTRPQRQHRRATVTAADILPLLWEWRAVGVDALRLSALELAMVVDPALSKLDEAVLIFMDGYHEVNDESPRRHRSLDPQGRTPLHQGVSNTGSYPGDATFFDVGRITVQLHLLRLTDKQTKGPVADPVPAIAVHLPGAPAFHIQT